MIHQPEDVFNAALAMPPQQRAALIEVLLDSFDEADRQEIEAAWVQEAEQRLAAYKDGRMTALSLDEVMGRWLPKENP